MKEELRGCAEFTLKPLFVLHVSIGCDTSTRPLSITSKWINFFDFIGTEAKETTSDSIQLIYHLSGYSKLFKRLSLLKIVTDDVGREEKWKTLGLPCEHDHRKDSRQMRGILFRRISAKLQHLQAMGNSAKVFLTRAYAVVDFTKVYRLRLCGYKYQYIDTISCPGNASKFLSIEMISPCHHYM
ncbi:hypothetical protein GQX74_001148 [Glossina fuscipes]|nr:hypothetical protein GQX74_001148 [Glossina fuscipes]